MNDSAVVMLAVTTVICWIYNSRMLMTWKSTTTICTLRTCRLTAEKYTSMIMRYIQVTCVESFVPFFSAVCNHFLYRVSVEPIISDHRITLATQVKGSFLFGGNLAPRTARTHNLVLFLSLHFTPYLSVCLSFILSQVPSNGRMVRSQSVTTALLSRTNNT